LTRKLSVSLCVFVRHFTQHWHPTHPQTSVTPDVTIARAHTCSRAAHVLHRMVSELYVLG
jgi:hypothetical protein